MKRLVLFSVAMLLAGFGTQSCIDNNVEPDPMAPGIEIYLKTRLQQKWAMDGANIAFRLNILLSEAEKQYVDEELDLTGLTVGDDENLFAKLFASGTVIDPVKYNGAVAESYTIKYNDAETKIDSRRKGSVTVRTSEATLTGGASVSWYVENGPDNDMQVYLEKDYYTGADIYANVDFGGYTISPDGTNRGWYIDVSGYKSYMDLNWGSSSPITSDWRAEMAVQTNFDAWDYETVIADASRVEVRGEASGESMYWTDSGVQMDFSYVISEPMVFAPGTTCSVWNFFRSATETATILNHSSVDPTVYPAAEAKVVTTSTGNCSITQSLTYNGQIRVY